MLSIFQLGQIGRRNIAAAAGGGFPTYLSATGTGFATDVTTHNVQMPATVDAGDLLIMQWAQGSYTAPTTPGGWTQIASGAGVGGEAYFRIYYKIAAGTEGGTTVNVATGAGTRAAVIVHRIAAGSFDAATAPSITVVLQSTTGTPNPPNHSPAWGALKTLWIAGFVGFDNGNVSVYPYVANNVHRRADVSNSGSVFAEVASCTTEAEVASLNPGAFTKSVTSQPSSAFTLSVKPA